MADASTLRTYRPSAFLKLFVRLEDFTEAEDDSAVSDDKPTPDLLKKAHDDEQAALDAMASDAAAAARSGWAPDPGLRAQLDQARERIKTAGTAKPDASGDPYSVEFVCIPLTADVEQNSFRTADTLNATLLFKDAPLYSDIIRSAIVELWLGEIPAADFATPDRWHLPVTGNPAPTPDPNGDGYIFHGPPYIQFRGYVDDWETSHDDANATVAISARSMESVLIDAKINPHAREYRIKGDGEPITAYVNRILAQLPATAGKVGNAAIRCKMYRDDIFKTPILKRDDLSRSLQSAKSQNQAAGTAAGQVGISGTGDIPAGTDPGQVAGTGEPMLPVKAPGMEMSCWELITQACQIAGLLATYDPGLDTENIVLRPPQTLFEDSPSTLKLPSGSPDGFERTLTNPSSGQTVDSQIRLMVWGHNIKRLTTKRKLGRIRAPAVEVISYNPDAKPDKSTPRVRFPPVYRAQKISAKGGGKIDHVVTRNVFPVRDPDTLLAIAITTYHELARQELNVEIETDEMSSYIDPTHPEGRNPDLLRLRPGSPLKVTVARAVPTEASGFVLSPLQEVFEKRGDEIAKMILSQNNALSPSSDPSVNAQRAVQTALKIGQALKSARIQDVFYVRSCRPKWSTDNGYSINIELVNYLELRSAPKNLGAVAKQMAAKWKNRHRKAGTADQTAQERLDKAAEARGTAR